MASEIVNEGAHFLSHEAALQGMVHSNVKVGNPVVIADPDGVLCEDVVRNIVRFAPERADDVVMVDFSDGDFPISLNPLDVRSEDEIRPMLESLSEALSHEFGRDGEAAPRSFAYAAGAATALAATNLALRDHEPKMTLADVPRFLQDSHLRRLVMNFCFNETTRDMFDHEFGTFEAMTDQQRAEVAVPVLRAFGAIGNSRALANIFGMGPNAVDFGNLVSTKRIVLVTLNHGDTRDGSAAFISPFVMSALAKATYANWAAFVPGRGLSLFVNDGRAGSGLNSATPIIEQARKWDPGLVASVQASGQSDGDAAGEGSPQGPPEGDTALSATHQRLLVQIRNRSRDLVATPRDIAEKRRTDRLGDVRTALTKVFRSRAGELLSAA